MPDLIRHPVTFGLIEHLTSLDSGFRRNDIFDTSQRAEG
jgi:hypothetical protein